MKIKMRTLVIDCLNAEVTASFYCKLLGWEKTIIEDDWILVCDPKNGTGLSFQTELDYVPPVWPEKEGMQQKMLHIDFIVDDLEEAVNYALVSGAQKAPVQYLSDVVVMLDPDNHPFCLFTDPTYIW